MRLLLILLGMWSIESIADEYIVAVRAHNGIQAAQEKWQATIDHLNVSIPEQHFVLQPIVSLSKLSELAKKNAFHFVLTNPSSYIDIQHSTGATALATLINKRGNTAQNRFGSVIFTRADRDDIIALKDLKNKTLMVVSEIAFGGWQVAWHELLKHDIDPFKDLNEVKFANGLQYRVVEAVLNKQVDAGVVRTDQLEFLSKNRQVDLRYLRILNSRTTEGFPFFHSTDLYPEWPFVALPSVPQHIQQRVQETLLRIKHQSTAAQRGGYISWQDALDYSSVKTILQILQQGPYTQTSSTYKILLYILVLLVLMTGIGLYWYRKKSLR